MKRLIEPMGDHYAHANVVRTGGPERVHYDAEVDANYKPRPAGFTAALSQIDPLVWDGDNA